MQLLLLLLSLLFAVGWLLERNTIPTTQEVTTTDLPNFPKAMMWWMRVLRHNHPQAHLRRPRSVASIAQGTGRVVQQVVRATSTAVARVGPRALATIPGTAATAARGTTITWGQVMQRWQQIMRHQATLRQKLAALGVGGSLGTGGTVGGAVYAAMQPKGEDKDKDKKEETSEKKKKKTTTTPSPLAAHSEEEEEEDTDSNNNLAYGFSRLVSDEDLDRDYGFERALHGVRDQEAELRRFYEHVNNAAQPTVIPEEEEAVAQPPAAPPVPPEEEAALEKEVEHVRVKRTGYGSLIKHVSIGLMPEYAQRYIAKLEELATYRSKLKERFGIPYGDGLQMLPIFPILYPEKWQDRQEDILVFLGVWTRQYADEQAEFRAELRRMGIPTDLPPADTAKRLARYYRVGGCLPFSKQKSKVFFFSLPQNPTPPPPMSEERIILREILEEMEQEAAQLTTAIPEEEEKEEVLQPTVIPEVQPTVIIPEEEATVIPEEEEEVAPQPTVILEEKVRNASRQSMFPEGESGRERGGDSSATTFGSFSEEHYCTPRGDECARDQAVSSSHATSHVPNR